MSMRLGPYLLLSFLLCVLLFIVGVKYGTYVEMQNKIVANMPTQAPTRIPEATPTEIPAIEFVKNAKNICGVSFLYPAFLQLESSASNEAELVSKTNIIRYTCDIQSPLFDSARDTTLPTESVTLKGKKITARVLVSQQIPVYIFTTTNTLTGKPLAFMVDKKLFPLVEKSLEYTR